MDIREVQWDKCQAVVNMVMNHWLASNAGNLISHGTSKIYLYICICHKIYTGLLLLKIPDA